LWHSWRKKPDLIHLNYVENQLGLVPQWRKRLPGKIIGTAHQPAGWWRLAHNYPETLSTLDALIVPASQEVAYFEQYLPRRVFYIPHGVDTDFFSPKSEDKPNTQFRCIYSGKHLRDLETLAKVVDTVLGRNPKIQFDILIPKKSRDRHSPTFIRLARHSQVHWYANLSDEELRELYRNSSALVLPLIDCTANNALVEAISCGLSVISNDVGGLRDYTRDSFASLFPIGDVEGMSQRILELFDDFDLCSAKGKAARQFAEDNLQWSSIAHQTLDVYEKIMCS
jgi:glycosyltransferase involved in cell wall biosynthesis